MVTASTPASQERFKFEDYGGWLAEQGVSIDIHESHYNVVCKDLVKHFSSSPFWNRVVTALREVDARYQIANAYPLISTGAPEVIGKPWPSFLQKTYRKNVLENEGFPSAPEGGWILPTNWFERIHDIVRTTIEVKYLDGVPLVLQSLCEIAMQVGCEHNHGLEARASGYYAAHFQCDFSCSIPDISWKMYTQKSL